MIKSIQLTNFFSFRDQTVTLEPDYTVLVGINGSGKSNFVKALRLLTEGMQGKLREKIIGWGGFEAIFCKAKDGTQYNDSIGLDYKIDKDFLSKFGYYFQQDIIYQIRLIKKPSVDNYHVSEKVKNDTGFTYLDFINGSGFLIERKKSKVNNIFDEGENTDSLNGKKVWQKVKYDDRNAQELVLESINDSDRYPALTALAKALKEIDLFQEFNTAEDSPIRSATKATGLEKLLPDGSNLFQILNTISLKSTEAFDFIESALREVNENFRGFRTQVYGQGNFEMYLREEHIKAPIHAAHISDGTLKYLCLLAVVANPARGAFISFDEPEKGLHPDMLVQVASIIQEENKKSSFLIATHSPNLLSQFPLRSLRVFEKDEQNHTVVRQFQEEEFKDWYDAFDVGAMWMKGDLGGTRW